jgi:predicted metalloprotease
VLSRDSRAERKLKALLRAQFRLKQALARIDFEEDVLLPQIEALKSGKSVLGLPEGAAFDIQIVDEDSHSRPTDHAE